MRGYRGNIDWSEISALVVNSKAFKNKNTSNLGWVHSLTLNLSKQSKMFHGLKVFSIVTISTLALSGCGGNSNNTGSTETIPLTLHSETPGVDPIHLNTITDETVVMLGERLIRGDVSCAGITCMLTLAGQSSTVELTNHGVARSNQQLRNGVNIVRFTATLQEGLTLDTYGLWGEFGSGSNGLVKGTFEDRVYRQITPTYSGYETGTNPVSGNATWSGAMAGVKVGSTSIGEEVTGDADMTADFISASVDLTFSDITATSGTTSPDINWENVPMSNGGFTKTGLEGKFHGFDHDEAGGIFKHSGIEGVFSLARQ